MSAPLLAMVESNTTGTGRLYAAAARARGFHPVLLSTRPDRYPWVVEDGVDVAWADTSDPQAVTRVCERLARPDGLAGVVTSSEYFVVAAARAAARLGLPGPDPGSVEQCRDKRRQRVVLRGAGVPVPAFEAVGSVSAAVGAASDLGRWAGPDDHRLPVVVKPADGTGSRGVRLCRDLSSVGEHARGLLTPTRTHDERGARGAACSRGGRSLPWVMIEEHVDGPEVSVETFGGEVVGVTAKHLGPLPHFVETGHDFPDGSTFGAAAAEVARRAVAALGLGWGPAHTEVRLGPAGPVVIEVNPRLAGGRIPVLVRLATGIDLVAATVDLAAGRPPRLGPPGPGHASIRFVVPPRAGRLARVDGLVGAVSVTGVCDVAITARPGDEVGGTGSFLDRIGHVIAAGADPDEVRRAAELALAAFTVVLDHEEGPPSTTPAGSGVLSPRLPATSSFRPAAPRHPAPTTS